MMQARLAKIMLGFYSMSFVTLFYAVLMGFVIDIIKKEMGL